MGRRLQNFAAEWLYKRDNNIHPIKYEERMNVNYTAFVVLTSLAIGVKLILDIAG